VLGATCDVFEPIQLTAESISVARPAMIIIIIIIIIIIKIYLHSAVKP